MNQTGYERHPKQNAANLFSGPDEVHSLGKKFDWSSSSLGPVEAWPGGLRTAVQLCLDSRSPMAVLAGPELLLIYNSGYPSLLGAIAHPHAFGQPVRAVWADAWEELAPEIERVFAHGESFFHREKPFLLERNGNREKIYFDYSFTPVRDGSAGVVGVFIIFQETTANVQLERDLRRMFELSHDMLAVLGTDDHYRRVNSAFTRVLGWSREEILAHPGSFFVHPEDMEKSVRELDNLAHGQPTIQFENRFRHRNGSYRWISWQAAPLPAEGLIYAAGRDITARKRVEEALRESERQMSDEAEALARLNELNTRLSRTPGLKEGLEEMLDAAISLINADMGNIQLLDHDTLRIVTQSGFDKSFLDFFREVSIDDGSACGRALRTGQPVVIDDVMKDPPFEPMRHVAKAAGFRAVLSMPLLGRSGKPLGIVSTHFRRPCEPDSRSLRQLDLYVRHAADLIERRQAEQALRESEERYRTLIRIMPAPVALHLGPEHRFALVSDAFRAMSGGRALIGETPAEAYPEAVGQGIFIEQLDEVIATGKPWISLEAQARFDVGKTGSIGWFNIRYEPVRDAEGRVIGVLNFSVDVTNQVRARRELERLLDRQAFLVRLSDALRPLADTTQIQRNASRLLGEHLDVDRVMYAEVEGPTDDSFVILGGYRRSDVPPASRESRFTDYGDYIASSLLAGKTLAVADVTQVAEHTPEQLEAYRSVAIGAFIVVPLVKDGRIAAYLVVNQRVPRKWTPDEVELTEETAERTWQAVERARAESALQRSEAFHRLAVEAGRIGTWDLDLNSGECTISPKMAELMNFPPGRRNVTRSQWVASVQEEDQAGLNSAIENSAVNDCPFDFTFRVEDGGVKWLYSRGDVWRDEATGAIRLRGASIDITGRKQTEEALRESEERLRLALDAADMGSFVWHAEGRAEADDQMFALFGLPPDGSFDPKLPPGTIHPSDRKRYAAAVARATNPAGLGELAQEIRAIHPDGAIRWLSIRARTAFAGDPPRPVRVAGVASDINDRKQAEQELRRLNAELRESDRRKDEFIAMLGHELRNPLAAIRNATDLMKLTASNQDERQQRANEVLDRQLVHITRLIDGLLEVSRIARGKIYLDRETLDLRGIVKAIANDHAPQIERRGLELNCVFPDEPVWVDADQVRLAQVFDNLLGNAVKFTDNPGTIKLTMRTRRNAVFICVSDTGAGIRPEMLGRLFEPFQQEVQEIARVAGGLGLGLALARGLVELHGGSIRAYSAGPGAGAEFEVRLPLIEPPSPAAGSKPVLEVDPCRILIVEDNPDARQTLRDLLEMLGHCITAVETGAEAIKVLRATAVDVVLCDLGLPGMSGYDVARTIRSDADLEQTRLVALTGYGQPEDRQRTARAGFDDHLTKPVNLEELNRVLRKWSVERSPLPEMG